MINLITDKNRLKETLLLGVLCIVCLVFSVFRCLYTDTKTFLFLNWNLFLAFLPWVFTSVAILKRSLCENWTYISLLVCSWLLFFPNAPYILTDLFHLRLELAMPIWFDLVLILFFAWTGLLFGFLSLWDIENILGSKMNPLFLPFISSTLLFISSFGIYVGRFLRWNSWDVITNPFGLLYDIAHRIIYPFDHLRTWGMTLFMGLFLNVLYWSFRLIKQRN